MPNFRVAINALSIVNRSGTGRVVEGLLDGLSLLESPQFQYDVLLPKPYPVKQTWSAAAHLSCYSIGPSSTIARIAWEQTVLPLWVRHKKCSVLHSPAFIAPVYGLGKVRSVVTIHDLTFLKFPETIRFGRKTYFHWAVLSSMEKSHLLLTDCESVRNELICLGIPCEKIFSLPLGVDERFFSVSPEEISRVRAKYSLPESYCLTVGTVEPRKNLKTILAAFRSISDVPPLVIAGRLGWKYDSVFSEIKHGDVPFLDYVDDADLPALYAGASLYLAPSLYEGFGLTVLEAMAAGCSVIASDIPAHRETGADYIQYLPPADSVSWASAISSFFNPQSAIPNSPSPSRARQFSWRQHAINFERIILNHAFPGDSL